MKLAVLFVCCIFSLWSTGQCKVDSGLPCHIYELAQYRLTFIGEWSEEKFPKQYPKFRPHAQWSKLIGRSHNSDYTLWSIGQLSTPSFKKFAQEGNAEELDKRDTQGFNGIFDTFTAPRIDAGVGESAVDVFVNHKHTMVSAAIRIIPSPDWFVGVDSVQLCPNGTWSYQHTVLLDPFDAGTDRGFTFTSPKWASRPHQPIYQIASKFPNHRANSFYYPELDTLPHIAYMKFELLTSNKQHKTHRQVSHTRAVEEDKEDEEKEKKREELEEQQILHGEPVAKGGNEENERVRLSMGQDGGNKPIQQQTIADDEDEEVDDEPAPTPVKVVKKTVGTNRLVADQGKRKVKVIKKSQYGKQHSRPHHLRRQNLEEKRDCLVGSWGAWSACSKTCGFGAQKRYRKVIQAPKNGRSCPALEQEKWCGSMRHCRDEQKLFSWLQNENGNSKKRSRS